MIDDDEFLSGGALAGALHFGFLDFLPVTELHDVELARGCQRVEAIAALLAAFV